MKNMTINEAISRIDSLKPNTFSPTEKIAWLSIVDKTIHDNIIKAVTGNDEVFEGYTDETDMETELLVPPPFDIIYIYWLQAQIDYWNRELRHYNESILMYNTAYSEYERHFIRTNTPKTSNFKFF